MNDFIRFSFLKFTVKQTVPAAGHCHPQYIHNRKQQHLR